MNTGNLTLASLLGALVLAAPAPGAQEDAPLRYGRTTGKDARIVNLPDANGIELLRPESGTLVSVWRELAGWLEVEVPGGYQAWVHGRYLSPTDVEGVFEVTRNAINIRPLPKSDVTSFPLPQRLQAGDRVRVIGQAAEGTALAETWARIVTPPGVHAWVRADEVTTLGTEERGPELWAKALGSVAPEHTENAPPARRSTAEPATGARSAPGTEPASAEKPIRSGAEEAARAELARLKAAIDAQRTLPEPDYAPIQRDLRALSATTSPATGGALRLEIDGELARLDALKEVARVRAELEKERQAREQEVWERERRVREASRAKDPLGDVFLSRGVLQRTTGVGEAPRYHIRFGGRDVCEVLCTSGRYDMDLLAGNEVGIFGDELQSMSGSELSVVDIRRLEILKRR